MPDGKILIFMQHGRSAGNALCAILQEEFGDENFFKLGAYDNITKDHSDFLAAAGANRHQVYGGHFCYGIHRHLAAAADYITTLREPVERALSNYEAWGRGRGYTIDQWLDHDYDSNDGMVKRHIGVGENDGQPYDYLQDRVLDEDLAITEAHLQQAIAAIERDFALVLLHSHLIESTVMLQRHYRTRPLFSIRRQFHNHLLHPIRVENYPSRVIDKIHEKNRFDRILYEEFRKRFLKQLAALPDDFHEEVRIMKMLTTILSERGVQMMDEQQILDRLTAGLNQLLQVGRTADAVQVLRRLTVKDCMDRSFCLKAIEIIKQIGSPEDLATEAAIYQARFGQDPALQALVA